jgi:hypothetical protein
MMKDDFKNLGFQDKTKSVNSPARTKDDDRPAKGELRW